MINDVAYQLEVTFEENYFDSNNIRTVICTTNFSYIIREIFKFLMDTNCYNEFVMDISLSIWNEGKIKETVSVIYFDFDVDHGDYEFNEKEFRKYVSKDYMQEYKETLMAYRLLKTGDVR